MDEVDCGVKKIRRIFTFFILSLVLSACSLKQNVATLYKQEEPLHAEIIIPDSFSSNEPDVIIISLTQNEKRVEDADYVHVEIWKQDGSVKYAMEQAKEIGNGLYSVTKDLNQEGLYFAKIHASKNGSIIMPQKQFIVGDLSRNELEFLQDGIKSQAENHEHQH